MEPREILIVVVTGAPAAGKTTLARPLAGRLSLPLIDKDTIKESLFDSLGIGDEDWSKRLGVASYEVMFRVARESQGAVLAANFYPSHVPALATVSSNLVQVFCDCDPESLSRRFHERAGSRHQGHLDDLRAAGADISAMGGAPLDLDAPLLRVDTTHPSDVDELARRIEAHA